MKFAIQSIVWGRDVDDLAAMLRDTRDAGYMGVELFQDFAEPRIGGAPGVFKACRETGMALVGVASGSFKERVAFVREYCRLMGVATTDSTAPYAYTDEWSDRHIEALRQGVRLGLHPHMFRPIQTMAEAAAVLKRHTQPNLQLLPDTAHLTIAGDDPVMVVSEHFQRIAAVHLKDWTPDVGRSYQFYGSGFCDLGQGRVKVQQTLDVLWRRGFRGWVVVEHDHADQPQRIIRDSWSWLRGVLPPHLMRGTLA